jgi:hypothetical protein
MLRAIARASRAVAGVDARRPTGRAIDARRAVGTFVGAESEELAYAPTKMVRARDERDDGARDGAMGGRRRCARVDGRRAKGRTRD